MGYTWFENQPVSTFPIKYKKQKNYSSNSFGLYLKHHSSRVYIFHIFFFSRLLAYVVCFDQDILSSSLQIECLVLIKYRNAIILKHPLIHKNLNQFNNRKSRGSIVFAHESTVPLERRFYCLKPSKNVMVYKSIFQPRRFFLFHSVRPEMD